MREGRQGRQGKGAGRERGGREGKGRKVEKGYGEGEGGEREWHLPPTIFGLKVALDNEVSYCKQIARQHSCR